MVRAGQLRDLERVDHLLDGRKIIVVVLWLCVIGELVDFIVFDGPYLHTPQAGGVIVVDVSYAV